MIISQNMLINVSLTLKQKFQCFITDLSLLQQPEMF